MIAVDTNILARFYCDDPTDPESKRQRPIAQSVMLDTLSIFVPLTVILEFEWVLRGFYEFEPGSTAAVLDHLLGMSHVTVEGWDAVKDAVELHRLGLDFADALHLTRSRTCDGFVTFDDRKFVRRARRLGLVPEVTLAH